MKEFFWEDPLKEEQFPQDDQILALGYFDGVHLGHQKVIKTARKLADQASCSLSILTMNKRPQILWQKYRPELSQLLTPEPLKKQILSSLGVDFCYIIDFNARFASLTPTAFVNDYLLKLPIKAVVAGFDYTFGSGGKFGISDLAQLAKNRFSVFKIAPVFKEQQKVSATMIRELIIQGNLTYANELLGRDYTTHGIVVHGEARGRTLGFPTANVVNLPETLLPAMGVYAVEMIINQQSYQAMASIGKNETFGLGRLKTVEINIFNFDQNIYGNTVQIKWLTKIRDQVRFASVAELVAQLNLDQKIIQNYFKDRLAGDLT